MPTAVLATKLFAPTRRPQAVARPRLTERLDATLAGNNRLTLVSAPAGFGKTTLLADWVAGICEREARARVAWLSLDEADNDMSRLLTHVVAALQGVGFDVRAIDAAHADSVPAILTTLVNDVARLSMERPDAHWILVLDDYHVIEAPAVHHAVAFLLDHLPDHVHIVMATRSDPPLPLSRLRTRGQLTEVRAADLRFMPVEAEQFLNRGMGLDLTPEDVRTLEERTEGWIAGLQLAALSLRGLTLRTDVSDFVDAFAGSNRFVIDYLADEVLARQPVHVRDFLLRTAVLDRLTGPLCDAVTGRVGGRRMLADLERENLFLVPLDDHRSWYRYHHLFADVLRARLFSERADEVSELHRRASAWCAANALIADAVRHALAAEDFERAGYLVETAVPEMRRARQDTLLISWLGALPEPVIRRSPVLSILAGWSLMMAGDLDAVGARLDDAEAALAAGRNDERIRAAWADTEDLRTASAMVPVYRASLAQARGDVEGTVRHAEQALDLAGPEDHAVRGAGAGFLGLAAWAAGNVHEALSTFGQAVSSLHAAGNLVDALDATIVLADMWVAAGRPSRARRLYDQGLRTATEGGEPYPRATADLHVGLAELDRELDDLASAEAHLETARTLAERSSITENRYRWYAAAAQVAAARGDDEAGQRLLDQAGALYRRGFYPEVRPIDAMKARLRIARGDLAAAGQWARDRGVTVHDDVDYLREYEYLTLVRLELARHRSAEDGGEAEGSPVDAVLGLLGRMLAAAASSGREGSVLEIHILQALAHHAFGDRSQALTVLGQAFARSPEPDSYVRLYLDEGPPMLTLLQEAAKLASERRVRHEHDALLRRYARRLLALVTAPTGAERGQPSLPEPLSERELQVLRLLASELTGPQIARELYVSVNTLRTHTKRIFTKLDVNTRAAAVRRARERNLL